jgi:hypothetical protein
MLVRICLEWVPLLVVELEELSTDGHMCVCVSQMWAL